MLPTWLSLLIMIANAGLLAIALGIGLLARTILRPPRMTDGKALYRLRRLSPGDLGLAYTDCSFNLLDERNRALRITAWWIPAIYPSRQCAVLIHGYADAKVGAIAWAPLLHSLGLNVLAPDLRAHGESGGTFCTAGVYERQDIVQVLHQLRAARPEETRDLLLFGISLGAAVAFAAATDDKTIRAVVAECPYTSFDRGVVAHMRLLGLASRRLTEAALRLAAVRAAADFATAAPLRLLASVRCPIMIVRSEQDALVSPADCADLQAALVARQNPLDLFWTTSAPHLLALQVDPEQYRQKLQQFVERALPPVA